MRFTRTEMRRRQVLATTPVGQSNVAEKIWTILDVLKWCTGFFEVKMIDSARRDAEVLIGHALGLSRMEVYLHYARPLGEVERSSIRELVKRRARREPVAYITGIREFWSLEFEVNPAVLIPRPETEHVVERALAILKDVAAPTVVDVGTGSGAILLALASELAEGSFWGTDISDGATSVARKNASRLGLSERVVIKRGDLLDPVTDLAGRIDLIVSNPPYIPSREIAGLMPEVSEYEPHTALDGGPDGLAVIRSLVARAGEMLRPGGSLVCEIHPPLCSTIVSLFEERLSSVVVDRDLASMERVVTGTRA